MTTKLDAEEVQALNLWLHTLCAEQIGPSEANPIPGVRATWSISDICHALETVSYELAEAFGKFFESRGRKLYRRFGVTELGDIKRGSEVGKNPKQRFIWVECPANLAKDCSGQRWALFRRVSGEAKIRICQSCNRQQTKDDFFARKGESVFHPKA